ncbi:MAG: class I SAM-dependent methyltransferase [Candidatus Altimarinota bacterium]
MLIAQNWTDYELLATGDGDKLERWGNFVLRRPDPQIIWPLSQPHPKWKNPDAWYHRSNEGGGAWKYNKKLPEEWSINYKDLTFSVKTMGFKHTGLFPEQAANWDWMSEKIQSRIKPSTPNSQPSTINVLNLFAYTGGATVACAKAGASVCHVDAAKNMVTRCKQNAQLSGLKDAPIRYITDDVFKFVEREIRRGKKYEGIIMDPPSYGRGPKGEIWKVEEQLFELIKLCAQVLSDQPLFFLVNSYTTGFSPTVVENILKLNLKKFKGTVSSDELGLKETGSGILLPCGISARWTN